MTEPDLFAQAILDAQPDRTEATVTARVSSVTRTYSAGSVVGASRITVTVGDQDLECDWLRGLTDSITSGALTEGSQVLVHLTGGQSIVADVIVLGAKFVG